MRIVSRIAGALVLSVTSASAVIAARPVDSRDKADYVVTGTVMRVYKSESEGYNAYIVEVRVEEAEKGKDIKPNDTFRAFCYQRKPGKGGLEFDTAGHNTVPKQGERVKMFVKKARGAYEGTYPDWVDILPPKEKAKTKALSK